MKNVWNIFRADWHRITASVVAVVVLLGLCLVPCLYAWFNILSNWDPYGESSTSRIKVAVASEDDGCEVLGLHVICTMLSSMVSRSNRFRVLVRPS